VNHNAKGLLDEPLWKITEAFGKYNGRYISSGVKEISEILNLDVNNLNKATRNTIKEYASNNIGHYLPCDIEIIDSNDGKCQLEHVTPRKKIIEMAILLLNDNQILNYLDERCLGCVVLKAEHNILNDNIYDENNPWARYRDANIRVWDKENQVWLW
jgi:hypothetical protein